MMTMMMMMLMMLIIKHDNDDDDDDNDDEYTDDNDDDNDDIKSKQIEVFCYLNKYKNRYFSKSRPPAGQHQQKGKS